MLEDLLLRYSEFYHTHETEVVKWKRHLSELKQHVQKIHRDCSEGPAAAFALSLIQILSDSHLALKTLHDTFDEYYQRSVNHNFGHIEHALRGQSIECVNANFGQIMANCSQMEDEYRNYAVYAQDEIKRFQKEVEERWPMKITTWTQSLATSLGQLATASSGTLPLPARPRPPHPPSPPPPSPSGPEQDMSVSSSTDQQQLASLHACLGFIPLVHCLFDTLPQLVQQQHEVLTNTIDTIEAYLVEEISIVEEMRVAFHDWDMNDDVMEHESSDSGVVSDENSSDAASVAGY